MSFKNARRLVLEALRSQNFRHEFRQDSAQKNLLQTGDLTIAEAMELVARTRGYQAQESRHHLDATVTVWVFRPHGWYIKFYLLEDCWFISFHPAT